jgi:hypothetical protein
MKPLSFLAIALFAVCLSTGKANPGIVSKSLAMSSIDLYVQRDCAYINYVEGFGDDDAMPVGPWGHFFYTCTNFTSIIRVGAYSTCPQFLNVKLWVDNIPYTPAYVSGDEYIFDLAGIAGPETSHTFEVMVQ